MRRVCPDCGIGFWGVEDWRVRCYQCWRARKGTERPPPVPVPEIDLAFIRTLLQLAHPDRNGNSRASHEATTRLLELKKQLERR